MSRLLAIDYGSKRTGLAVTDPLRLIATALEVVPSHQLIDFLKKYLASEKVEAFIVGLPVQLDNSDTNNTPLVRAFIKKLGTTFPEIRIYTHDERFTSSMAMQSMIVSGVKKSDRSVKGNVDKVSATIILQSFMESREYRESQ